MLRRGARPRNGAPRLDPARRVERQQGQAARPFSTLGFDDGDLYVSSAVGAVAASMPRTATIRWLRRYAIPVHVPRTVAAAVGTRHRRGHRGPNIVTITPDQSASSCSTARPGDEIESHDARARDGWERPST